MSVKQHLVTAEELWEMPEVPGKRFELVDGEVIEVSPAGDLQMAIAEIVYKRLDRFVEQHNLGLVRFDGLGYVVRRGPDQVLVPDVSFRCLGSRARTRSLNPVLGRCADDRR